MVAPTSIHSRIPTVWSSFFGVPLVLCGLLVLSGCVAGQPNWLHPGSLQSQRYNAIAHDPYADSDAGPEIVGGRPRDFQKPLPEPVRNRWLMDSWWSRR